MPTPDTFNRQRDFTQAMLGQVLAPQQNQSALTGIARVLSAYLANKNLGNIDEQQKALEEQERQKRSQALSSILQQTQGRPEEVMPEGVMGPPQPAQEPVPLAQALVGSDLPEFQDAGLKAMLTPERAGSSAVSPSAVREYEFFKGLPPEQQNQYLAVKRAGFSLGGTRYAPSTDMGNMQVTVPPRVTAASENIVGLGKEAAKGGKAFDPVTASMGDPIQGSKQRSAKEQVSGLLNNLSGLYSNLQKSKGITDTEGGTIENLLASAEASGPGQLVGRLAGSENQSFRNQIKSMQPLLLNNIRQASEMGARGLDSEKELEFYLQAATDPTRDVQTAKTALYVLDNAYGLGEGVQGIKEEDLKALKSEFERSGKKRDQQELPPTNEQGWQLMEDAQGNKAYVGPNGEIQEL